MEHTSDNNNQTKKTGQKVKKPNTKEDQDILEKIFPSVQADEIWKTFKGEEFKIEDTLQRLCFATNKDRESARTKFTEMKNKKTQSNNNSKPTDVEEDDSQKKKKDEKDGRSVPQNQVG